MLQVYGSLLCPDCIRCKKALDDLGIEYLFIDINSSMASLKAFLRLRDTCPVFDEVKKQGKVGIPLLVYGQEMTLDYESFLELEEEKTSCGINGC